MRGVTSLATMAVAVLAAGCNPIFGLDPVGSGDGGGDAAAPDADLDATDALDRDALAADATIDGVPPDGPAGCVPDPGGQPDEDADGRRDACDNCPFFWNAPGVFPDVDGDGVGDLCDPGVGPHHLVAFHGFAGTTVPPELVFLATGGGTWTVSNGQLQLLGAQLTAHYLARIDVGLRDVSVVTQVTVLGPLTAPTPGTNRSVGAWVDIDPATPTAFPTGVVVETAEATTAAGATTRFAHLVGVGASASENNATLDSPGWFTAGTPYRLHVGCRSTPTSSCDGFATYPGLGHPLLIQPATTRAGAVGLRVHSVDAAFDYVAIYAPG